jgi:hypothetical protein
LRASLRVSMFLARAKNSMVLHQFHCDFSLTARQSSFSKLSRTA